MEQPAQHETPPATERLSAPVVRMLVATVLNAVGNGVAFPFLFVFLHEVRGFSSSRSGLILAATGVMTLVVNVAGGSLVDRIGPRRQLFASVLLQAAGFVLYIVTTSEPMAFLAALVNGAGFGLFQPASGSLLVMLSTPATRARISAYQRAALNLGMGLGGVLGGVLADKRHPHTYTRLFTFNIVTFAVFFALIATVAKRHSRRDVAAHERAPGYGQVLRDGFFMRLLVTDLAIAMSFSLAFEIMPGFASAIGARERVIGLLFLANTLTVVLAQVPSVRLFRGRSRLRWVAAMNAIFAVGFVAMLVSVGRSLAVATALLFAAMVVFGLGECILGAVRQPLTADLAPAALVGRYYGLAGMAFQGGMAAGKSVGGYLLGVDHRVLWSIAGGVAALGAIASLRLERRISPKLRVAP